MRFPVGWVAQMFGRSCRQQVLFQRREAGVVVVVVKKTSWCYEAIRYHYYLYFPNIVWPAPEVCRNSLFSLGLGRRLEAPLHFVCMADFMLERRRPERKQERSRVSREKEGEGLLKLAGMLWG